VRIGILKTGHPSPEIGVPVPSYTEMVRTALGPSYTYRVYDQHPWIARLRAWLNQLSASTPLVGICFGHQIMAEVYGGHVERFSGGMAVGLHRYKVNYHEGWMDDRHEFVLPAAHYDQVVEVPPAARVFATSEFCPYAGLAYVDRCAVSFQAHPEFSLDFCEIVIEYCQRKGRIAAAQADAARASLRQPEDCARIARWIRGFLDQGREQPHRP
jgi:GMP synthase-like glutamine amidotransferase